MTLRPQHVGPKMPAVLAPKHQLTVKVTSRCNGLGNFLAKLRIGLTGREYAQELPWVLFLDEFAVMTMARVNERFPHQCVCGLSGPNGVGKTTIVRILTTPHAADAGRIPRMCGRRHAHAERKFASFEFNRYI